MNRYVSIAAIAIAGLVHMVIAPGQLSYAPAPGMFFGCWSRANSLGLSVSRVRNSALEGEFDLDDGGHRNATN